MGGGRNVSERNLLGTGVLLLDFIAGKNSGHHKINNPALTTHQSKPSRRKVTAEAKEQRTGKRGSGRRGQEKMVEWHLVSSVEL
jgi:hypothetical protein